jgi:hypothetical protein
MQSTVKIRFGRKKILNYAYRIRVEKWVGRTLFFNFYTKSSYLCRFRVESVNICVCAIHVLFQSVPRVVGPTLSPICQRLTSSLPLY